MKKEIEKQKYPIYKLVDGNLVRKPNDYRDPNKRYGIVLGKEVYLREFTEEEERQADEEAARWKKEAPQREIEEKRREKEEKKKAIKLKESFKYETKLVAFVDILGWSASVQESADIEQVQKLGLALHSAQEQVKKFVWMNENWGNETFPGDPKITQFSDCLVISVSNDSIGKSHLLSALDFLSKVLISHGFLLRGGITFGHLYHQGTIVFGPALLKAYEIENRYSIYPRIILDPTLTKEWGQNELFISPENEVLYWKTWRIGHDGFTFFDFIQPFSGNPLFFHLPDLIEQNLELFRDFITKNMKLYSKNYRVLPKYIWLANYFNDVCKEYDGHNIQLIKI